MLYRRRLDQPLGTEKVAPLSLLPGLRNDGFHLHLFPHSGARPLAVHVSYAFHPRYIQATDWLSGDERNGYLGRKGDGAPLHAARASNGSLHILSGASVPPVGLPVYLTVSVDPNKFNERREELLEGQRKLKLALEESSSPARLEEAGRELGMQPARAAQIEAASREQRAESGVFVGAANAGATLRR